MTLVRWSPFHELRSWQKELGRVFDECGCQDLAQKIEGRDWEWIPSADIRETKDQYEIQLDLPGVNKEDVKVSLSDEVVTIQGEKKSEKKSDGDTYHTLERRYGSFSRSFRLPGPVSAEKVKAEYKNGVLNLIVPKAEDAKPKQITID